VAALVTGLESSGNMKVFMPTIPTSFAVCDCCEVIGMPEELAEVVAVVGGDCIARATDAATDGPIRGLLLRRLIERQRRPSLQNGRELMRYRFD
jgi:hypothetical protein